MQLVRQWNPDVVLLDLMLPDNDRIAGLKTGADDYVAKPFALEELGG